MRVSIGRRALFDRTQRGALVRVSGRAHSDLARLAVIKPAGSTIPQSEKEPETQVGQSMEGERHM
jgi:hypothetical protein